MHTPLTAFIDRIGQVPQWLDYRLLLPTGGCLPISGARLLARLRAAYRYRTRRATRDAVRRHLAEYLTDYSRTQIERLCRDFFLSPCLDEQETYLLPGMTQERLRRLVEVQGKEHLQACLDRGKGAIVFTGHTSSTCMFGVAHGMLGFPANAIVRPLDPNDSTFPAPLRRYALQRQKWIEELMGGSYFSPDPKDLRKVIRRLQNNEIVIVLLDAPQDLSNKRVLVDFLGKKCLFPTGIARLAEETGCGLVPGLKYYHSGWSRLKIHWEEPLYASGDVQVDIQRCARHLENMIRRNPSQWYIWDNFPMLWAPENLS